MKYNVDDKVVVINSEDDTLIGKSGRIIEIDDEWIFPYELLFDNEELNGSNKETLFAEEDIIPYSEYMKRYEEPVEPEITTPDSTEEGGLWLSGTFTVTPNDIITEIRNLVNRVKAEYPQCRESSLVITKLDEARLWLNEIGNK